MPLKESIKCRKFKEEALDRTLRRTRFGRGCGPVARQVLYEMYVASSRSVRTETRRAVLSREIRTAQ
jgi:hypothetical protein